MFPASQSSYTNFKFVLLVFALVLLAAAKATAATSAGWSISIAPSGTPSYKATWTSPSGSGSNTSTGTSFTPPTPATNSISVGTFGVASKPWPVFATKQGTATATFSLNVTITGTWQGPGTAPSSIEVVETSQAEGAGNPGNNSGDTASDGLGDTYTPTTTTTPPISQGGYSESPSSPPHVTTIQTSGNTFTLNRSFSGSATETYTNTNSGGYVMISAAAELVSYSLTVHPTPYGFYQTEETQDANGLHFTYSWFSTDGNVSDLSDCYEHEYVVYQPYTTPYFIPPTPFNDPQYDPTITPASPGKNGTGGTTGVQMNVSSFTDNQEFFATQAPYSAASFSATQVYEYFDSVTNEDFIVIPGCPTYAITRAVYQPSGSSSWDESVTKGVSGTKNGYTDSEVVSGS